MVVFACSGCGQKLRVKDEAAGTRVKCPCGCVLQVPAVVAAPPGVTLPSEAGELPANSALAHSAVAAQVDDPTLPPVEVSSPGNGSAVAGPGPGAAAPAEYTNFLAPAQGPGELGRLGPYRVLKVLGAGGMGIVFQAEDPQLQRQVALKVMLPTLAASLSARQRFLREARAAAAIEHDHIVTIYQVGEDRGVPFLAMPFLQGEPLDEHLNRSPTLLLTEVLRIGREAAEGLAAAHQRGLIHRDIKPANIWLEGERRRVKILDFGLARAVDDQAQLTQQGAIIGTPAYMAPEQATDQTIDRRCDLFSLGCILYRMTAGRLPFQGTDTLSTLMAVATEQPRPPRELNPEVPPELSDLIMQLLAKNAADRPASARAVVEAIQVIAGDRTAQLDSLAVAPRKKAVPGQVPARGKRRLVVGGVIVGVAALGLAAGASFLFRGVEPKKDGGQNADHARADRDGNSLPAGAPLSPLALVSNPAPLKGVQSWTIAPRGHRGPILALAHSPEGRWLASAGEDGVIRLWDSGTGKLVRVLEGHAAAVNALAWSPDRKMPVLASAGNDRTVQLWDGATGKRLRTLEEHRASVAALTWLDARTVAARIARPEDRICVWEADTGKFQRSLKGPFTDRLTAFHWSPDGKRLATGHPDRTVKIWDAASGKLLHTLEGHRSPVLCLAWSADGQRLASGDESRMLHFWNAVTGRILRPALPAGLKDPPLTLAWSPDGQTIVTSGNFFDRVRGWRLDSGELVLHLSKPQGQLRTLAWSPDGKTLVAGHQSAGLLRWDASTGKGLPRVEPCASGTATAVWSPDGKHLAICQIGPIQIWDAGTGKWLRFSGQGGNHRDGTSLAWSPDGTLLAVTGGYAPDVWNAGTGHKVQSLKGHTNFALAVAWSPDSKKVASTATFHGQKLLIHEAATGKLLGTSPAGREVWYTGFLAWSPDGKTLAANSLLWDVSVNPFKPRPLQKKAGRIRAVAWSPKGTTLATGGDQKIVQLWKPSGEPVGKLAEHQARVTALHWLSEERLISLDADGTVCFWDVPQGKLEHSVKGLSGSGSFSPDGRTLASPVGSAVRLWDVAKGRATGTLTLLRLGDTPPYLGLSADGHYRGSRWIEREIVYVVQTDRGQEMLTPGDFAQKYGWKNDPKRVRLIGTR